MDEGTTSKTDLLWARILVKLNNNAKYDSVNLIAGNRVYVVQLWWEISPTVMEVTWKSYRDFGGPADSGEEDDRDTRAKRRVNHERKESCLRVCNGLKAVGNRNGMRNRAAAECLENGKTRGGRTKVGDNEKCVFQIDGGNRGRNGKMTNALVLDPLKDRAGLYLEGAAAHEMGKVHGFLKGQRGVSPGEKKVWPMGRSLQPNPRYASKGGCEEKMGTKNHGREKEKEEEMPTGELRAFQVLKSSQDQGRCKGYNMKQVTSRKERNTRKVIAGSEEEEEERGEGRCYGASEQETIEGKLPEKTSIDADMEVVRAKEGFLCEFADSVGSVIRGANQVGGYMSCWRRNSGMSTDDSRSEVEGEDNSRVGKRVGAGEARPGSSDGTRPEASGSVRQSYRKEQEETDPAPGQISGAGRVSGTEWASGRELGRPNVSNPVMGLFYRAALSPVSSILDLLNEMSLYESSSSKVKAAVLEPGLCQDLLSKTVGNAVCFGSTSQSSEGQKGNDIKPREGEEIGKIVVQEAVYSAMNRYDDKRYSQHSPIPISIFGRPLLLGGFSGQGFQYRIRLWSHLGWKRLMTGIGEVRARALT